MNEPEKNENPQNPDPKKSWFEKVKCSVEIEFKTKKPLKLLVLFLQGVSIVTTFEGAKIIFPNSDLALTFAGIIQATLVFLVLFEVAKESPIRKWFSVIVVTFISIYASFFSFYNQLAGDQEKRNQKTATQAHYVLVKKAYADPSGKLDKLKAEENNQEKLIKEETEGEGESGIPGKGDKRSSLVRYKQEITKKILDIGNIVEKARPLSESVKGKTANQIFEHDSFIMSEISQDLLDKYEVPKVDRKNYIESDGIGFVTPYNKIIKERDQNAIVSLFMALTIDGLALILGSAIDTESYNLFDILAGFCGHIILGFKRFILTLFSIFRKEVEPYQTPEADGLKDSMTIIILLDNKGSEFLLKFYESINFQTHIIDIDSLIKDEKSSISKIGYRLLLDTMKYRPLKWIIEIDSKKGQGGDSEKIQWRVSDKHYPSMKRWLARQIREQLNEEKKELVTSVEFLLELKFPL